MITGLIRTAVTAVYGALIAQLIMWVPAFEPMREQLLAFSEVASVAVASIVTAVVAAAWWALVRKVQPILPPWLVVALAGSLKQPTYVGPTDHESTPLPDYLRRSDVNPADTREDHEKALTTMYQPDVIPADDGPDENDLGV